MESGRGVGCNSPFAITIGWPAELQYVPATTPNTEIREKNAAAEPRSGRARWIGAQGPERLKRLIVVVSRVECDV
jgi:hypothetical protein